MILNIINLGIALDLSEVVAIRSTPRSHSFQIVFKGTSLNITADDITDPENVNLSQLHKFIKYQWMNLGKCMNGVRNFKFVDGHAETVNDVK